MASRFSSYSQRAWLETTSSSYPEQPAPDSPWWVQGSQPVSNTVWDQTTNAGLFGLGIGAAHLFGRHRFGEQTGYDFFLKSLRGIEEYSPGRVLRTFQLSHLFSPLESRSQIYRYFPQSYISRLSSLAPGLPEGRAWIDYMSKLIGRDITLLPEGFRYEGGQLLSGATGGDTLLRHASIIRNPAAADPKFLEAYARSLKGGRWPGVKPAFSTRLSFLSASGAEAAETFGIIGGHTKLETAKRFAFGYGTSLVERFNQLARAPFELPIISDILRHTPIINRLKLSVPSSSGLKTLGALTWRLGVLAPLGYTAYQHLDWAARNASIFDNTLLAEGITAGVATLWTRGQVAASKAAEFLGGHQLREWQESVAPGSTEIQKLATFPILGGLGGVGLGYLHRLRSQISLQIATGMSSSESSLVHQATQKLFLESTAGHEVQKDFLRLLSPETYALATDRAEQLFSSRWGKAARWLADKRQSENVAGRTLGRLFNKPSISRMLGIGGLVTGLAMVAPFIPGALVPSTRPEELARIYSGEQEVPIRKGRWWEAGRSSWEGDRIDRYRPHWYPRMLSRATDIGIYGEDMSPYEKFWKENFTYDLEKFHYYDRPYPVTSTAFEDVPFIGPFLAATIGKIVKPPLLMHTEEWAGGGGAGTTKRLPLRYGERLDLPELGEMSPGSPVSPYGYKGAIGEQAYKFSEMIGLPGFVMTSIKERMTGSQDLFDQEMQLQSARKMFGVTRSYWDLELGGMAGSSEIIRRLYPHERRQIEKYNPIKNQMPSWLPGPGEKSPDFQHSDPYTLVTEGELRLPGPGYEALHPELKGVDPESYPDIWKLKILADVAPYSEEYGRTLGRVRAMKNARELTEKEEQMFDTIIEQIKERKNKKKFQEYLYRERKRPAAEETLARINEAYQTKGQRADFFSRMLGSYWETIGHGAETPLEFLTPVAPASKLMHMRTAIEDYERTNLYGSQSAFWQHPIRNFLRPFGCSLAHSLGWEGTPGQEQLRRDTEQYFDALKYVKFTRLSNLAAEAGNWDAMKEYQSQRKETLLGLNPYTFNYSHIFRSLPRRERDYFNAFIKADTEEREQIMGMVPENEKALFAARWQLEDVSNWQKAIKTGGLSSSEEAQAEAAMAQLQAKKETEGFPVDDGLWEEYKSTKEPRESYADWYRRVKLLPVVLAGRKLPGPDWCGFDPRVRLDEVKLKVLQNLGESPFDYDIWPDTARAAARHPYTEQAAEQLYDDQMDSNQIREQVNQLLSQHGVVPTSISIQPLYGASSHEVGMDIDDDRSADIRDIIRRGEFQN